MHVVGLGREGNNMNHVVGYMVETNTDAHSYRQPLNQSMGFDSILTVWLVLRMQSTIQTSSLPMPESFSNPGNVLLLLLPQAFQSRQILISIFLELVSEVICAREIVAMRKMHFILMIFSSKQTTEYSVTHHNRSLFH